MKNKYLYILILIFLSLRLLVLFTSEDLFDIEESRLGMIAKEIIRGPTMPILEYHDSHQGGMLVNGFLIAPFFILFGEGFISLKLVWLLTALASFILLFKFLERFFHRKIATTAAILFIFSPPFFTFYNLTDGATHLGGLFFTLLIMVLFFHAFFADNKRAIFYLLFGFTCGLAVFFEYSSLIMIFCCLLFWFISDKIFFLKKYFFIFLGAALVGLSPWIYYNITHNFSGLSIYRESIFQLVGEGEGLNGISLFLNKSIQFIIYNVRDSFNFKQIGIFKSNLFNCFYYITFVFSFIYLLLLNRKAIKKFLLGILPLKRFDVSVEEIEKSNFILMYPVIFSIIFCLSDFDVLKGGFKGFRYLLCLYPFIFMIISLSLVKIWNGQVRFKKVVRCILAIFIFILCLLGLFGNLRLISLKNYNFSRGLIARSYGYDWLGFRIGYFYKDNLDLLILRSEAIEDKYKPYFYEGIGRGIGWHYLNKLNFGFKFSERIDAQYKIYFQEGFSKALASGYGRYPLWVIRQQCRDKVDDEYKPYCYEAVGRDFGWGIIYNPAKIYITCSAIEKKYRDFCFEGVSRGIGWYFIHYPELGFRACSSLDEKYKPYFYKGIGRGIGWYFIYDPGLIEHLYDQVEERYRADVYVGCGMAYNFFEQFHKAEAAFRQAIRLYEKHERYSEAEIAEGLLKKAKESLP